MICFIILAAMSAAGASANADLQSVLRAKDQALLDAVAPGDSALWDRTLTADAIYIDENGDIMDRAAFMKELKPLGPGVSGNIRITDYRMQRHGDQAFVIQTVEETEDFHGAHLTAHYIMSENWRQVRGDWKLGSVHAYVVNADPPATTVSVETLKAYVGRFELSPGFDYIIKLDGDALTGGYEGRPERKILVETGDVLFTPGNPRSRKIFQRDSAGNVTGFIDRREGEDLVWRKVQ